MNYQLLFAEISRGAYAGMTDAEIVAALNAVTVTRRRVPIAELQARAMETGVYTALRAAVASAQVPDDLKAVCQTVLDLAQARFADVDMDNAASVQMFGAIQQAGIITVQQAAAIDALANVVTPSRATALGLGAIAEADIQAARDWKIGELQTEAALIEQRLGELTDPTEADLLAWAQENYPFAALAAERNELTARLTEINDLIGQLGG